MLGEESPLDATEVAERACVLAPSLTRIIKALEERKLITRKRDMADGRRISLAITPAGLGHDPRGHARDRTRSMPISRRATAASASSSCSTCWASSLRSTTP